MKLIEISPFVRFAYKIMLRSNRPCITMDSRLFYITEGDGTVLINDKKFPFSPGTVLLWQAGTKYNFLASSTASAISINFDFTLDNSSQTQPIPVIFLTDNVCTVTKPKQINFEDCPILNAPIVCTGNSTIYSTLEKILFENTSNNTFSREKISALMKDSIVSIIRAASSHVDSRSDNALETVMEYIHENYNRNVDNRTLAELVGYHPYYLNKLFLISKGITLHKYVSNYRIAVSEQLLLSSTMTIDEIALQVGFSASLSFSSSFKKKNGITPSEFRKRFGGING